jgi:hypothetical protein
MESGESRDPEEPEDLCDMCYVPLDPDRTWVCADCFAECEKVGRCAKLPDPAVWEKIEHLKRLVGEPALPIDKR